MAKTASNISLRGNVGCADSYRTTVDKTLSKTRASVSTYLSKASAAPSPPAFKSLSAAERVSLFCGYSIIIQRPPFLSPSRIREPSSCIFAKSRSIVLSDTDNLSASCIAVINGLLLINSRIDTYLSAIFLRLVLPTLFPTLFPTLELSL